MTECDHPCESNRRAWADGYSRTRPLVFADCDANALFACEILSGAACLACTSPELSAQRQRGVPCHQVLPAHILGRPYSR